MGSWNFTQIGMSTKNNNEALLKQLMDCLGVNFNNRLRESEGGKISFNFHYDTGGEFSGSVEDAKNIFYFVNKLFPNTYVYYEKERGNSISDDYYREEAIFDPVREKCIRGEYDYSYGDCTANNQPAYMLIRVECEKKAQKQGIKIKWREDDWGGIHPGNYDFSVLCDEVLRSHGGISGLGTEKSEYDIDVNGYDKEWFKEYIDTVIKKATEKGYVELTALIIKKCRDVLSANIDDLM